MSLATNLALCTQQTIMTQRVITCLKCCECGFDRIYTSPWVRVFVKHSPCMRHVNHTLQVPRPSYTQYISCSWRTALTKNVATEEVTCQTNSKGISFRGLSHVKAFIHSLWINAFIFTAQLTSFLVNKMGGAAHTTLMSWRKKLDTGPVRCWILVHQGPVT